MENKIDAYLEARPNDGQMDYNMYFKYNGVDSGFLNRHPEQNQFARLFKACLFATDIPGFVFTNQNGTVVSQNDSNAVLSSIHGLDNITNYALRAIMAASEAWDVEADLVVHLNGQEFKLVSDEDEINYISSPGSGSLKGRSDYVINDLINNLENLKNEIGSQNKRI